MLERDDFAKRYAGGQPIAIHEFLYPLVQGYDSVAHCARMSSSAAPIRSSICWSAASCRNSTARRRRSSSPCPCSRASMACRRCRNPLGNYVGITDAPAEMFGKVMSVSDTLMWRWFELLSFRSSASIEAPSCRHRGRRQPARHQVPIGRRDRRQVPWQGRWCAAQREAFLARFSAGELPADIPEVTVQTVGGKLTGLRNCSKNLGWSPALRKRAGWSIKVRCGSINRRSKTLTASSSRAPWCSFRSANAG